MKKVSSLFLLILLVFACGVNVRAAVGAELSGADSVAVGETVELILSVSDCPDASSASVDVSYGEGFELVSGTWIKTGALTHYDTEKNKGAVGGLGSPDINGDLFKLVLKAKTASADAQPVSITTTAKNGVEEVMRATVEKHITISCTAHIYDTWRVEGNGEHQLVCSGCGQMSDISAHKPGAEEACTICNNQLPSATEAPVTTPSAKTEPSADPEVPAGTQPPADPEQPDQNTGDFPWWIVIAALAAVLCGVVFVIVKKR